MLWSSDKLPARLARIALTPASWVYAAGWQIYLRAHQLGVLPTYRYPGPVFCVGNLTVGGSGKTPVTIYIAQVLTGLGRQAVISCNGYGSPAFRLARMAPEGPLNPLEWGDEPAMIRDILPGVPLVVGKQRAKTARLCAERYPYAVLLLDDGFQHLKLHISTSIILDDRKHKAVNRRCLPAGPMREPGGNAKRADLRLPGHFRVEYSHQRFEKPDGAPVKVGAAHLLCAVGSPDRLVAKLKQAHVRLISQRILPDHASLQEGNLFGSSDPDEPVIVTAKDWVKLRLRPDIAQRNVVIVRREARIEPEEEFRSWIEQRLNEFTP